MTLKKVSVYLSPDAISTVKKLVRLDKENVKVLLKTDPDEGFERIDEVNFSAQVRRIVNEGIQNHDDLFGSIDEPDPDPSDFQNRARQGEKAESLVSSWLETKGAKVYRFRFRAGLSDIVLPREFKALLERLSDPPDLVVNTESGVYFADVKFKTKEIWAVNITDYRHYHELSRVVPVKIFFVLEEDLGYGIYVHDVMDPVGFEKKEMWNGNNAYLIRDDLIQKVAWIGSETMNLSREAVKFSNQLGDYL